MEKKIIIKFFTLHSQVRPYMVILDRNRLHIFAAKKNMFLDEIKILRLFGKPHIEDFRFMRTIEINYIFIGRSILNNFSKKQKTYGRFYNGNTILAKRNNDYIFISVHIYALRIMDNILEYYSCVDENNIPHPVAISLSHVYFLSSMLFADRQLFGINWDSVSEKSEIGWQQKNFDKIRYKYIDFEKIDDVNTIVDIN